MSFQSNSIVLSLKPLSNEYLYTCLTTDDKTPGEKGQIKEKCGRTKCQFPHLRNRITHPIKNFHLTQRLS